MSLSPPTDLVALFGLNSRRRSSSQIALGSLTPPLRLSKRPGQQGGGLQVSESLSGMGSARAKKDHYITPHTLLTFGIKMFFDVY